MELHRICAELGETILYADAVEGSFPSESLTIHQQDVSECVFIAVFLNRGVG